MKSASCTPELKLSTCSIGRVFTSGWSCTYNPDPAAAKDHAMQADVHPILEPQALTYVSSGKSMSTGSTSPSGSASTTLKQSPISKLPLQLQDSLAAFATLILGNTSLFLTCPARRLPPWPGQETPRSTRVLCSHLCSPGIPIDRNNFSCEFGNSWQTVHLPSFHSPPLLSPSLTPLP